VGESLTEELLKSLLDRYAASVSCVAFMGGDNSPAEVNALMAFVRRHYDIKIAWYSGRSEIAPEIEIKNLDFVKLGPYIEKFGGLDNPQTNQRFYEIDRSAKFIDKTELFRINQKNILPL
jgi:anaerobic ribonucleoside-triphosphate reductase activating protein